MADGFLNITFQVAGQKEIQRSLADWGMGLNDLSRAWTQIGRDLLQDNDLQFASEGGAFPGPSWAPLMPSTVAERLRLGYGGEHPILQRTGDLRTSLTMEGAAGNVFNVRPDGVEVGTIIPYAGYHQGGTSRMAARPVVGITNQRAGWVGQDGSVVDRLNQEIKRQMIAAGLTPDS